MDYILAEYALSLVVMTFGVLFAYEMYSEALHGPTSAQWLSIAVSLILGLGFGSVYLSLYAAKVRSWKRWAKDQNATYARPKAVEEPGYGTVVDEVRWFDQQTGRKMIVHRVYNSSVSSWGKSGPHVAIKRYAIIKLDRDAEDNEPLGVVKIILFTPSISKLIDTSRLHIDGGS